MVTVQPVLSCCLLITTLGQRSTSSLGVCMYIYVYVYIYITGPHMAPVKYKSSALVLQNHHLKRQRAPFQCQTCIADF